MKKFKVLISTILSLILCFLPNSSILATPGEEIVELFCAIHVSCMDSSIEKTKNDIKNIYLTDTKGRSVLMYASGVGCKSTVEWLINYVCVSINQKDRDGNSALNYAVAMGHNSIVEVLQKATGFKDDDIYCESKYFALQKAFNKWHEEIAKLCSGEMQHTNVDWTKTKRSSFVPSAKLPALEIDDKTKEIMKPFDDLVGLQNCKKQIIDFIRVQMLAKRKKASGLEAFELSMSKLNMVFVGNPGTGKTTVAKMIAEVLFNAGLIKENKIVFKESANLIAKYKGQSAPLVKAAFEEAKGGVLFIDEAYSLRGASELRDCDDHDFANAVITTLLTELPESKCMVIIAGYEDKINDFLSPKSNAGLYDRFPVKIHFTNFSTQELYEIFDNKRKKNNVNLGIGASNEIKRVFEIARETSNFSNARFVNNFFDKVMRICSRYDMSDQQIIKAEYIIEAVQELEAEKLNKR